MQSDEKKLVAISIAAILLLTLLYAYRENMKPRHIALEQINRHVGEYVEIQGTVVYTQSYRHGMYIEIAHNNSRVSAYFNGKIDIPSGEIVTVRGIVEYEMGKYVLQVDGEKDIIFRGLIEPGVEEILRNPQYFVGLHLKLHGNLTKVERWVSEHYIRVSDGVYDIWVYVSLPYYGERDIYIAGCVKNGMLYADKISLNETSGIPLVPISEISQFEGKCVQIHGYVLNYSRMLGYTGYLVDNNYHLKVILKNLTSPGYVTLHGTFEYFSTYGEYALVCK